MWKPSKRKPMYASDIRAQQERERASLQSIVHGALIIGISMFIWYAFNACAPMREVHACQDLNSIECAQWKQEHDKERHEQRQLASPRGR